MDTSTPNIPWLRLQHISCAHARQIGKCGHRQHHVPDVIQENVEILGKGTDEQVKARLLWYHSYYPALWGDAIDTVRPTAMMAQEVR